MRQTVTHRSAGRPVAGVVLARRFRHGALAARAAGRTAVFFLKVLPTMPSRLLDLVTPRPMVETVTYPTSRDLASGDLYRPATPGPHPGIVVCLGVVPFDVDHPQVPRLGEALARSGFAALLYWSPAMRDLRLDPDDVADLAGAYEWLIEQPYIDPSRSGLFGTCVGGAFALMAAADQRIRHHLAFVGAFAPYSSMWTLAEGIASSTREDGERRVPWPVDQLTRRVYDRSLTDVLEPGEAALLRQWCADPAVSVDADALSDEGRAIFTLLEKLSVDEAAAALERLPARLRVRLDAMSPMRYLEDIHAPLILFGHDRDDAVIPVDESRRLGDALAGRPGVSYTEFGMFQHADPTKKKLAPARLLRELSRFFGYVYPLFRQATAA
jgi:fermentation-respiration switch protein FrsA (DUF1100 family)